MPSSPQMPKVFPIPALVAAVFAMGLAGCDRAANTLAGYSTHDAAARPARSATPAYPSATPETVHATAPAPDTTAAPRAEPLSREALSDTAITGRVKAAILTDPALAGTDISVNTDSGVVTLTGTVKTQEQAAIASVHAQGHDGVMRIDNHLSTLPL